VTATPAPGTPARAVVIGVGNPFRRDDGVGPAVLDALRASGTVPETVRLVDSDGEPTRTLLAWDGADTAVVIDAVRTGAVPGTVHRFDPDELPETGRSGGSHALGPGEAVLLGRATGRIPARLVLIGVEVEDTAMGVGLTDRVASALGPVIDLVLHELGSGETHRSA
jgi:hydrogenase maturation protease